MLEAPCYAGFRNLPIHVFVDLILTLFVYLFSNQSGRVKKMEQLSLFVAGISDLYSLLRVIFLITEELENGMHV
jgi:hypothetical protein